MITNKKYQSFNKDQNETTVNFAPIDRSYYCWAKTQNKVSSIKIVLANNLTCLL